MLRCVVDAYVLALLLVGSAFGLPQAGDASQVVMESSVAEEMLSTSTYEKDGVRIERVRHNLFEAYQLRVTEPKLCDKKVQQYSGYLDIADDKHLFFWFFEARYDPSNAPLMLWLNGGPGGSTIASGLLFEHGPCRWDSSNRAVIDNPYGWNEKVNVIYLDQPVGTGFSYGAGDSTTLANLAEDVYAFLQLFAHRFPRYAELPLHVAGESWGGHYVPHIGQYIDEQNDRLVYAPRRGQLKLNLASLLLGNGLTEPASQFETITDYLCGGAPYPPFDPEDSRCRAWRAATPACLRMIDTCYKFQSNATCVPATSYCWPTLFQAPLQATNKNVYDLRRACDDDPHGLCYAEFTDIERWLNATSTKRALGVAPGYNFQAVNSSIQMPFYYKGQAMLDSAALLAPLVDRGIRVLAYAGDVDGVCNYMGIELWMSRLEHKHHPEFTAAPSLPWKTSTGYYAGRVRSAGDNAVTFVRIFDAGHMAPYDQPEATLDMITKWVDREDF